MHIPEEELHTHIHEDGTVHSHGADGHTHSHGHTHTQTKAVLNRLSRAIGHLESVKRMVEDGRDCSDVLIQLAAVRSALNSTAKVILKDHLEHCINDAGPGTDDQLAALNEAIDKFMS
ncbi:MAG: metal-sensing transcriptional repressor [Eubacteriales bacterium]|nr:metal-sensing transcriptional repressor [Eubacteriales bacterium]